MVPRKLGIFVVLCICWFHDVLMVAGFCTEKLGVAFQRSSSQANSVCHLFFRVTEESRPWRMPEQFVDTISKDFQLPCQIRVDGSMLMNGASQQENVVTIRLVEDRDVRAIVNMCVEEYGSGPRTFPWAEPWKIVEWYDLVALQQLVEITTRLKLTVSVPVNHAVVVASLNDEQLIGMIEVSRQPVEPNKNPSPIPYPLIWKKVYCQLFGLKEPQGWITNLLVTPQFRGKGVSKVLVAAAEGIAREWWNCQTIHLHCDANTFSGRIPQMLYLSMGYKTLRDPTVDMPWIPDAGLQSGVFFVDGVPLLYMRKDL